ncbi:protein of unknown function (plasmid) [Cupriavidus taiwanensis]|uniref:Uncharacterized protein n=1 Tax=Cupriavidus taiwanensis TaxID=164546 RepID=A0A375IVC5_9BURK|nr:protein of unknown function [Cupriavidus taiwanensis]
MRQVAASACRRACRDVSRAGRTHRCRPGLRSCEHQDEAYLITVIIRLDFLLDLTRFSCCTWEIVDAAAPEAAPVGPTDAALTPLETCHGCGVLTV